MYFIISIFIGLILLVTTVKHIRYILILDILNKLFALKGSLFQDVLGSPKLNNIRDYLLNYTDQQIVFFTNKKISTFKLFHVTLKMFCFKLIFRERLCVAEEDIKMLHFANLAKIATSNQFSLQIHEKISILARLSVYSYGYLFVQK